MSVSRGYLVLLLMAVVVLPGCDDIKSRLGITSAVEKERKLHSEGHAAGAACRQIDKNIASCYDAYYWLPKSAIYQGWREMDGYLTRRSVDTGIRQSQ